MNIPAIPTRYAGCHFRSRLEARWAVFFDALDIEWEYEAQGYRCHPRLSNLGDGDSIPYLPDFWLPTLNMHAEVKGSMTPDQCLRLLDCIAWLSCSGSGYADGPSTVILGAVPKVRPNRFGVHHDWPWVLYMHKGDLRAYPFLEPRHLEWVIARDYGGDELCDVLVDTPDPEMAIGSLLRGCGVISRIGDRRVRALASAASARFEHGESGAT